MSASAFSAFPFPSKAEHGFKRGERFILSRSLQGKDTQAEFSPVLQIRQVQPQLVATTFHSRVIVGTGAIGLDTSRNILMEKKNIHEL